MTKKSNKANRANKIDMDLPEVINMDDLSYASDSDLHRRYDYLNEDRGRALSSGYDATAWEVELAYVQREFDIRRKRIAAHEKYLHTNPEAVDVVVYDAIVNNDEQTSLN